VLKLIPRHHFGELEAEHGWPKARSFTVGASWCTYSPCNSRLESVCGRCFQSENPHKEPLPPGKSSRSPLTFAEPTTSARLLFEALFGLMYRRCSRWPEDKFKFKNKLFSLDATW